MQHRSDVLARWDANARRTKTRLLPQCPADRSVQHGGGRRRSDLDASVAELDRLASRGHRLSFGIGVEHISTLSRDHYADIQRIQCTL